VIVDFAIWLRRLTAEASRASNISGYDTGKEIRYIQYLCVETKSELTYVIESCRERQ
jgi:hypothetical protein